MKKSKITKTIHFDNNNLESIRKAERQKMGLENKGYTLQCEFINSKGRGNLTYTKINY